MRLLSNSPSGTGKPNAMLIDFALASAGGYADAASYLLAGSFTGHLTGNTVLSAIALGGGNLHKLFLPVLAVTLFVCGTAMGLALGRLDSQGLKPLMIALSFETILVACAAMSGTLHALNPKTILVTCLCLALGIQNGVFRKTDGVSVHATYVTGDVTSLIASLFPTNPAKASRSQAGKGHQEKGTTLKVLGSTWLSFSGGALVSVLMVRRFGTGALWLLELPIIVAIVSSWKSSVGVYTLALDDQSS